MSIKRIAIASLLFHINVTCSYDQLVSEVILSSIYNYNQVEYWLIDLGMQVKGSWAMFRQHD